MKKGAEAAVKRYKQKMKKGKTRYRFGEKELNRLGYQLMLLKKIKAAIEIFKLNVELYPESFNVFDNLGEAYMIDGDYEKAIKYYKKSLELNPRSANAETMYGILLNNGYLKENIYVLYADGIKKDNDMPVNYRATKGNITKVFDELAKKMTENDTIYIMLNDHGGGFLSKKIGSDSPGLRGGQIDVNEDETDNIKESDYNLDLNSDGKISVVEAYNFGRAKNSKPEIPFFEDNGILPHHAGKIPAGGDGIRSDKIYLTRIKEKK
jgi:tetratricopeptide (TPR) repeat protein